MKKILCPIDFSEASLNGLHHAFETAKQFKAELVLFHSIHIPSQEMEENRLMPADLEKMEEKAKDRLEKICEEMEASNEQAKISYYFLVKFGFAEDEILELIKEQKIDMVIMGTKGAEGINKMFGTLSADIAYKAPCPVLIIPEGTPYKKIERIVYATDIHGKEETLFGQIVDFARAYNAQILFLNVQKEAHEDVEQMISYGIKILDRSDYKNMSFHVLEKERTLEGINSFTEKLNADLLVMAVQPRNFIQSIFSISKTKLEAYQTKLPLLAMHKETIYQPHL